MLVVENVRGAVEVRVIGRCPIKGCRSRRTNTLTGRIHESQLGTRTSWGIPTEYGEQRPNPFEGNWRLENVSASRTAMAYFRIEHGADLDPRLNPNRNTSPVVRRRADSLAWAESMYVLGWVCEDHDRFMKLNAVNGVVNVDKTCDGRCTNATGPNCECSCGGRLHGASWN